METVSQKFKSLIQKWAYGVRSNPVGDIFDSVQCLPTEEELVFEEMDVIVREEINRLEQGLTDYLRTDVENRYVTRIVELYERWAFLEPPENLSSGSSCATLRDFEIRQKQKELKARRALVEKQIAKRISIWKKISLKKAIVE
ncbi:hypothetical protein FO519_004105 [Halicephalobus sp. NKZ332]|nr:hypothetical protein FO519_004105 [Halicephalobus sp. NKZ332]